MIHVPSLALSSIQDFLRDSLLSLHPVRYFHCLLVKDVSCSLGKKYDNISIEHLKIASLSHDMLKYMSLSEAKNIALQYEEPLPQDVETFTVCIHGFMAAILLKHRFHISNASILQAVRFHTTGSPHFDHLGLILYIADYLASLFANQQHQEFYSLYKLADSNIQLAALQVCDKTLQHLKAVHKPIHPLSLEFRSWLKSQIEGKSDF